MVQKWRAEHNAAGGSFQPHSETALPSVSRAEYERVRARLREVEQERDILKKALGIFSREI